VGVGSVPIACPTVTDFEVGDTVPPLGFIVRVAVLADQWAKSVWFAAVVTVVEEVTWVPADVAVYQPWKV
jgi:hypothetical protein